MSVLCYLQGKFIPLEKAQVAVNDRGFLYGDGLFETIPVYEGNPFYAEEHLLRLSEGADIMGLPFNYEISSLEEILKETVKVNSVNRGFLRLTLSRGKGKRGLSPEGCTEPLLLVVPSCSIPYSRENYKKGYGAIIVKGTRRNSFSPLSRLKTLNYLDNILARMEADKKKAEEGILLNSFGNIACGTVSNIFIYKNDVLVTPSSQCGILKGITRQIVIKMAHEREIQVEERPLDPEELMEAEEAFLTNSLMEIMPLTSLEGKLIGKGKPGLLSRELKVAYEKITGCSL